MEWLNYHHLRYFHAVAMEGGLRKAAERLHVSQPSLSAQIRRLEDALGEPLFERTGRRLVLTDAGKVVLGYANEIFTLGSELMSAVRQWPGGRPLRLQVGISDTLAKTMAHEILRPVFTFDQPVRLVCREGKLDDLLAQLATHRLDIVLADEPSRSGARVKTFDHPLGVSSITFCASPVLATMLRKNFPSSLMNAPVLLPTEQTALRMAVEKWFKAQEIEPEIIAEFDDSALMKVFAADGLGFVPIHTVTARRSLVRFGLKTIAEVADCTTHIYAITAERRLRHPVVLTITDHAHSQLFGSA